MTPAVVRGSIRISEGAKLLFGLMAELDQPKRDGVGGCWMSETELAKQLGMNPDSVSALRLHLLRLGLLCKLEVPGSRVDWWFLAFPDVVEATLPVHIRALPKARQTKPAKAWREAQTAALDRYVLERERVIQSPIIKGRERKRPPLESAPPEPQASARRSAGPQSIGELVGNVPEVVTAIARSQRAEEEPPPPNSPPADDDEPEELRYMDEDFA
jgi:hypothetical protein